MIARVIKAGLLPKPTGDLDGINGGRLPSGLLVAGMVNRAVL
jgi:hypothetical protein